MLKLMYITPKPDVATIAMTSGVDRIFVDMETIGKDLRQAGMNTVQSKHTFDDIKAIKKVMLPNKELLVRSNPIHSGSEEEILKIIDSGADIVMLPYFTTDIEVEKFVSFVAGKAKCCILIESKGAVENLDKILAVKGVDEYYVGLNDLHLDYGLKFMFQPLANGLLDSIIAKLSKTEKPFGFGGVARIGDGALRGEYVVMEHYRLKSSSVILARAFCNSIDITDLAELKTIFTREVANFREFEKEIENYEFDCELFSSNHTRVVNIIENIVNG